MKTQKGFLIAILVVAVVGVAVQVYAMTKKKKEELAKRDYNISLGELEQEVLED